MNKGSVARLFNQTDAPESSVVELLQRAKTAIATGENSLRAAAELIASAESRGATQRHIAETVGKSVAWVNRLLQWRRGGYKDETPFGRQSKDSRQRSGRVQSPKQGIDPQVREVLVKTLGMLGSDQEGERAAAALKADQQRVKLGLTWDEVIVRADSTLGEAAQPA